MVGKLLLIVLAALAFFVGGAILMGAKSALHEIEAFIVFLIGSTFLTGAFVADAIGSLRTELTKKAG